MPESDLWVVSWLGMPMYDADFGWGTPRFVAPAQMFGSGTAYVTQRANRDDGLAVLFGLEPEYLQCFEKVFYGE
jgi:shikimate O-hydroxycinnamoyltransferase